MANKIILYCRLHPCSKASTLSSAKLKMNSLLSDSLIDQVHNLSNFSRAFLFFYFLTTNKKIGVRLGRKVYSITLHEHLCYYNLRKGIISHQVSLTYQAYRVFRKPWLTGNKLHPTNSRGK